MPLSDVPGMPQVRADRAVVGLLAMIVFLVAAATAVAPPAALRHQAANHQRLVPATSSTLAPGATYPGPIGRGTAVAPLIAGHAIAANQVRVAGTISNIDLTGANLTVKAPFTITAAQRGSGNGASITDALVGGRRASIGWDAGQPLPVTGSGAIDLVGVEVHGDAGGLTPQLGGATFELAPGTYRLGSTVAISTGSLAEPLESVTFVADAKTRITFQGQASLLATYPAQVTGPGNAALQGVIQAATASGSTGVGEVRLDNGPYAITFTPGAGAVAAIGELQGSITMCPAPGTGCAPLRPAH